MAKRNNRRGFNNRVVAYLRYSTQNQNELSIEYQREEVEKYCNKLGYIIVKYFVDEAKSATNDKREAFDSMIKEAMNEPTWSKIIVFSFNRFARNVELSGYYNHILNDHDIKIESATQDNSDTPEARLARNIAASYDAYMPECCAVHTHASLKTKAKKCEHCGGTPPLGYDVKNKKLVVNKDEAETVRMIFEMYDNNYSYNSMIKELAKQGRTTKRGTPFTKGSFNSILTQEKYKGIFIWNRATSKSRNNTYNNHSSKPIEEQVRIEGGCKPIVDAELFDRVQEKMKANCKRTLRSAGRYHYMLGGMNKIYCAECGALMVGSSYKSHGKNYRYYACPNHKQKTCSTKNLRASYLERMLASVMVRRILNKYNFEEYNPLIAELYNLYSTKSLNKELKGTKKAIDNILKVIETTPTEEAQERLSLLIAKKASIQSKIDAIDNSPKVTRDNLSMVRKALYKELIKSSDPITYKMLDLFIDKITVNNETVELELTI